MESNARIGALEADIAEWQQLKSQATRVTVVEAIAEQITATERLIASLKTPSTKQCQEVEATRLSDTPKKISEVINNNPIEPFLWTPIRNYAWDQTNDLTKLYITLPESTGMVALSQEAVKVSITPTSLEVTISMASGQKRYRLFIPKLHKAVKPSESKYRVRKDAVHVTLRKAEPGRWEDVKYKEKPPAPKLQLDPEDNKMDPGASLMKLMKNLYDEGDDEMKRTITKAWVESQEKHATGQPPF